MANRPRSPRPVATTFPANEAETVVPVVETPDPEHPVPVVAVSDGRTLSPESQALLNAAAEQFAPGQDVVEFHGLEDAGLHITVIRNPHLITELGLQPVALASRTYASDFGPGGAASMYRTLVYDENGAILGTNEVKFHGGELADGINGISDSTLLSILADRWTAFQAGPFACKETGEALSCIHMASVWLNARTKEREARGVEGRHEA